MSKKVTLTFNIDECHEEASAMRALTADKAYRCLREISEEIFRPARKHGYQDAKLNELLEKGEHHCELIGLLEDKFWEILRDNEVNLGDYY